MPAADSPAVIVARFLKSNNYTESYDAFIAEAGLPYDAGTVGKGDLTLETLLEEKKTFDVSVRFEKLGVDGEEGGWRKPSPQTATEVTTLPSKANVLSVTAAAAGEGNTADGILLVTTADRRLHLLDAATLTLRTSLAGLQDSPILSCVVFRNRYLLTASMSGQLVVSDLEGNTHVRRRDHTKYVVKISVLDDRDNELIATAGWDNKVNIYRPPSDVEEKLELREPVAVITLTTKPEAMLFIRHPETSQSLLLISRTDSSFLYYYTTETEPRLLGRQNLAPHSNAWVAFTPSALALSPTDPTLVAVGTSTVPHMKLLIVRLLIPPFSQEQQASVAATLLRTSLLDDGPATETQASQARAALAVADREDAAIMIHCTTLAPQTAYSTPAVVWRPDGSGVWVNGDDGAVRGIEVSSGKVVVTLKDGHEAGSKVRCLWAGMVQGDGEVLVSGGFDQRLIVWKQHEA